MSAAGIDAVTDLDTLLTDNWNSSNTDSRTPTITDNLQKAWEDVSFGTEEFLYIKLISEEVKTGLYAADFFHYILCTIEIISPGYGTTDERTHFNKVVKEVARIIKANPRRSGYAMSVIRNNNAPRYQKDRNMFIGSIDVEMIKVTTS